MELSLSKELMQRLNAAMPDCTNGEAVREAVKRYLYLHEGLHDNEIGLNEVATLMKFWRRDDVTE